MGKKIVYKAANMFEPEETKYGYRRVMVEDAPAIVVLEVDDDDILSDISKRRAYMLSKKIVNNTYGVKSASTEPINIGDYDHIFPEKILSVDELENVSKSTHSLVGYLHSVKCRASKARVIDILDGRTGAAIGHDVRVFSIYDGSFEYMIGRVACGYASLINRFSSPKYARKICGPGIHYFERIYEAYLYGCDGTFKNNGVVERLIKYAEGKNMGDGCEDNA